MDALVTGVNGQLGFEIARLGSRHDISVGAFTRNELDISDSVTVEKILTKYLPKVIINAGAYTAVDNAENERDVAFAVNRDGPEFLAAAAEKTGATLIHVSTDYVFDGTKSTPYVEEDQVAPLGTYGASKEAGECAVREATDRHIILRSAWVFNVHGKNFVKTMLRAGAEHDELSVVDDQIGCPTYAVDLAEGILTLASRLILGSFPQSGFGTFHCAGGGQVTWCGFARKIFELSAGQLAMPPKVTAIPTSEFVTPVKRPANSVLDCSRLELVHGISLRPWPDALAEMLTRLESGN